MKHKTVDLTKGNEMKSLVLFTLPLIGGNLFQQLYNLVDTVIVGKYIGSDALAAVGSSYMTMSFLTSVIIGLCMGSGVVFSLFYGAGKKKKLRQSFFLSFLFILVVTVILNAGSIFYIDQILKILNINEQIFQMTKEYLLIIMAGMSFVFLYNYFAAVLRSMGDSMTPLKFLIGSSFTNISLDYLFVVPYDMGVRGAALATVLSQMISAAGILLYSFYKVKEIRFSKEMLKGEKELFQMIVNQSLLTSIQQSIMNFGILMIQGLVNSFGITVMAGFAAAVKIESFAYMPVQDFGNAFSTYAAQNKGAGKVERIQRGTFHAVGLIFSCCAVISTCVVLFSRPLMQCFVQKTEVSVIEEGIHYLHVVAPFYCLIGWLFLLYGLYRGLCLPWMSIVLTIISLGTRVALAYGLTAFTKIGVTAIWWAIPTGWLLADLTGFLYYHYLKRKKKI